MLRARKERVSLLLAGLSSINTSAAEQPPAAPEAPAFDFSQVNFEYLAPGTDLLAILGEEPNNTGGRGGRGGRGGFADPSENAGLAAGELGAMLITVQFQTPLDAGLPFFERSVLTWLRENAQRTGRPYQIVDRTEPESTGPPDLLRVERVEVLELDALDQPDRQRPGSRPGGGGQGGRGTENRSMANIAPLPDLPGKAGGPTRNAFAFAWAVQITPPDAVANAEQTP